MTIAAGFRCNQGIVLCADSQVTISGYIKQHQAKIFSSFLGDFVIAIAGAGTTDYIQTAVEVITDNLTFSSLVDVRRDLRDRCVTFFRDYLQPWSTYPESERPTVELLIAVTGPGKEQYHGLFHYQGTSFANVYDAKAIGAGILLANNLISKFGLDKETDLGNLSSLAIFIIKQVKEQVDTCGGYTELAVLRQGGGLEFATTEEIESLESSYEAILGESDDKLKAAITEHKLSKLVKAI